MDLYFLDHLCFFWTLGMINNHITEKSLYFESQPAIILKWDISRLDMGAKSNNRSFLVIASMTLTSRPEVK